MKAINKLEDFEFVKKNEFLKKYINSKEYSDLIKYLEIETWNRIGTNFLYNKKNGKKNKVSEITLTENIVYLLTMISEEYGISDVELFEDFAERESGADLKLQLEIYGKYLEIPVQCKKIDFETSEYKSFKHDNIKVLENNIAYNTLSKTKPILNKKFYGKNTNYVVTNQFELISNEIENNKNHIIGLYFFYNSLKKSEMAKYKIRKNEKHHFYGISYLDIESLKKFSKYDFGSIHTRTKGYPLHYLFNLYDEYKNEFLSAENLKDNIKDDKLNSFLGEISKIKSKVSHKDVLIDSCENDVTYEKHLKRILIIRIKNNSFKENRDKKNMENLFSKETYLNTIRIEFSSTNKLKKEENCFDY